MDCLLFSGFFLTAKLPKTIIILILLFSHPFSKHGSLASNQKWQLFIEKKIHFMNFLFSQSIRRFQKLDFLHEKASIGL